jgi:toxin FitB
LSCVLDSDVVIAHFDDRDAHHRAADRLLGALVDELLVVSLVNYAEVLVRPAEDDETLRAALKGIEALDVELVAPTRAVALDAARFRALGVSLADGFAMATARARGATLATFDRRVQRALPKAGIELAASVR